MPIEYIFYWLIAGNLVGFVLMIWDKAKAEAGEWRVAESTLILWSLIGGSIGTLAASRIIRHKARKQPIATLLMVIPIVQLVLAVAWLSGLLDLLIDSLLSQ